MAVKWAAPIAREMSTIAPAADAYRQSFMPKRGCSSPHSVDKVLRKFVHRGCNGSGETAKIENKI